MRKRRNLLLLAGGLLVVAVLLVSFVLTREPAYGGRRLSKWVRDLAVGDSQDSRNKAKDAVGHIGTNAIPFLLKWISYEQPGWKTNFYNTVNGVLVNVKTSWTLSDRKEVRAEGALLAFQTLGSNAVSAIPGLTYGMNDPEANRSGRRQILAISALGKGAIAGLAAGLTNHEPMNRLVAIKCIEGKGFYALPVVPSLLPCLNDNDERVACAALWTLGTLRLQARRVVPALANTLQDSRPGVRSAAVYTLLQFGDDSLAAVPALVNLLNDPDYLVRAHATNALRKIDPQVLNGNGHLPKT